MRSILVTGASGFVGGAIHRFFANRGWLSIGAGRRGDSSQTYIQQDLALAYTSPFEQALSGASAIVHAAARSSPWGTVSQFQRDNILATEKLLEWAETHGKPHFLFISSASVYYQAKDQLGLTEETPQAEQPVNRYAASKQIAERLVRGYRGPWTILRPRAVYGPGDTVLFPRIMKAAQAKRLPWFVRSKAPAIGDLIYIENLVHYVGQVLERQAVGEFNLTDNAPIEINAFLADVFKRLDIPIPQRNVHVRTAHWAAWLLEWLSTISGQRTEPPITRFGVHVFAYSKTFDVTKMLTKLGAPPFTTEQGVDAFVEWIQKTNPYT